MISLTTLSHFEVEIEREVRKFYEKTGPVTFTWYCLSPWAKSQWVKKFWKRKGIPENVESINTSV